MRNFHGKLVLALLSMLLICTGKLQAQDSWTKVKLDSFEQLAQGNYSFLHPEFLQSGKAWTDKMQTKDLHTAFTVATDKGKVIFTTFLAEDNPMNWELTIIDDKHAEWSNLSCDCNVGLESSIFSNNRNPYKKVIASLTLADDGRILIAYADEFKKNFLNKSRFSNAFFQETYQVYQQKK